MDPTTIDPEALQKWTLFLFSIGNGIWLMSWAIARWSGTQENSAKDLAQRITSNDNRLKALEAKPDAFDLLRRVITLELRPNAELLERDIKTAHARMDQAGKEMSDLATDLQGFEHRMRAVFVSNEVNELQQRESREDRARLREQLDRHRDDINELKRISTGNHRKI